MEAFYLIFILFKKNNKNIKDIPISFKRLKNKQIEEKVNTSINNAPPQWIMLLLLNNINNNNWREDEMKEILLEIIFFL